MLHDALSLPAEIVNSLFPFHILLSVDDSKILSVGTGLQQIASDEYTGASFYEKFDISRPEIEEISLEVLKKNTRSSFVLHIKKSDSVLRGQFLLPSDQYSLFVGSILVKNWDSLEKLNINLNVFAPFDLTPDIVIMHKFRQIEQRDQKQRAQQLSDLSKSRDEMNTHANTDELTDLVNRRGLWSKGTQILSELKANSSSRILLALLDLDGFKSVNDLYGHEAGDAILKETADRISDFVGTKGLAGRLGGDEFVVLSILDEFEDAQSLMQQLLAALNHPFIRQHQRLPIRASVGVTEFQCGNTLEQTIHQADIAMYEGRAKGRGKISWYTSELQAQINEKELMISCLKKAIDCLIIEPFFQPIVELTDYKLSSFEALARWHDPELGSVSPDIFIALAEEAGLLAMLDRQILEKSLDQLVKWHAERKYYSIHVNLSAASLTFDLIDRVLDALKIRNLKPCYLTLELTETTILGNTEVAREILDRLTDSGVKFQLDDFGTGFSSLSHIRDFPVSGIKIDRSFVVKANTSDKSQALLKSVVAIAKNLDLDIVAEGIETQEQLEFLQKLGCQYGQGYYIGRPETAHSCELLFAQLHRIVA